MEDEYAKPVNVAAFLVDAYAQLLEVFLNCVFVTISCGHIAEGLGDVYAAFLHIYHRLVRVYMLSEDVSWKAVESQETKEDANKFNGR